MTTRVAVSSRMSALLAVVFLTAVPSIARGQVALSVEEAVTRALARAPRIAEARARQAAASATVEARSAEGRPSVTSTAGILRTNHVDEFGVAQPNGSVLIIFPDIPNNYRARAEMTVPLYTSGRVGARVTSAQADVQAADADTRGVAAEVELVTVQAYWTLVTARARVTVLERAQTRADASVADVQARVDTGLLPPNDLLSAQAQRARQRVQLIQAANDASVAETDLARLIGAEPGESITPTTPVSRPMPGSEAFVAETPAALARRASTTRPERAALLLRQDALRASIDAAMSATRPQVGALVAIEPARPNPRWVPRMDRWHASWDLGLSVTWSVWDSGRSRAERASATAQVDALAARVDEFDENVAVEVRQRQLDLASTRAALEASHEAVTAATEARRVVGERFSAGVATSTEVLDSDVAMLEAELERTRLEASLRVGEARLIRAAGGR